MIDVVTRAVAHAHGHVGWLAAAALAHPAWLLRRPVRRLSKVAVAATALITLPALSALAIYPAYRASLKQALFVRAAHLGWMFERKEHLGLGAVALAWAGLALHLASIRAERAEIRLPLARGAHACFVASAVFTLVVSALGSWVAAVSPF